LRLIQPPLTLATTKTRAEFDAKINYRSGAESRLCQTTVRHGRASDRRTWRVSELVLEAMRKVPREEFLLPSLREFAYEDSPLPIAEGQTISQPYIVAFMADALLLRGGEKVLEIGTGSGYAAAVLAEIAANVYSVERIGQLAEKAAVRLAKLGCDNVHVLHADGTRGWPEHAPYDAIVVAAGGPKIPQSLNILPIRRPLLNIH
jgi:protein-L-isoaspartate(D-aspartate) O-methyltransferase